MSDCRLQDLTEAFPKNFSVLIRLLKSLNMAKKVIRDFKPDVVVGVGGYASGPVLRQAGKMGIPPLSRNRTVMQGLPISFWQKEHRDLCCL